MNKWYTNTTYYLETSVIDDVTGAFISGLTITYEVRNSDDNTLFASGTLTEEGNAYKASIIFTTAGQYRVFYTTPSEYENGMNQIIVEAQLTNATIYDYFTNGTREDAFKADVSGLSTILTKVLGLVQSNFRITDNVYDLSNNLLSATIKIYNNSADCDNDINAITTYAMVSTYDADGNPSSYKVTEN
jgi:hypothetical protein